jgi:hypothetical protein
MCIIYPYPFTDSSFRLNKCAIFLFLFLGDDCETDTNACADSPCALGRSCSDLTPAEEGQFNRTYNWWFSKVSYTNKTDRHDIIEILLKVALNTIKPNHQLGRFSDITLAHERLISYMQRIQNSFLLC